MGCAPGFTAQPSVLNGASHIVNQIFGPRGRHTRMIYSNNEMPMDCATLVVLCARSCPINGAVSSRTHHAQLPDDAGCTTSSPNSAADLVSHDQRLPARLRNAMS